MHTPKVFIWPAAVLALAAALYAAAWSVPVYYGLMPVRVPFELREGATRTADFRARLDTTYIVMIELERMPLWFDWKCYLGDQNVNPGQCTGEPSVVDLAWSVTTDGKVVASGDTRNRVHGFPWSDPISRVIGRFDGAKGTSYVVNVESRKDGTLLDSGGPNMAVQADSLAVQRKYPGVFRTQVMGVPLLNAGATVLAVIGLIFTLGAAAQWYVNAPVVRGGAANASATEAQQPLNETETFRIQETFRRGIAVTAWFCAALTAVLAYFALVPLSAVADTSPILLGAFALSTGIMLQHIRVWRQAGKRIEASESGIAEIRPNNSRVRLDWHEIREIRHRPYAKCLELRSSGATVQAIRIEEQTERFAALRDLVIGKAPQAAIKGAGAAERKARLGRRITFAFWSAVVLAAVAPSLWEKALFAELPVGAAADRAVLEKSSRTLSLYRGDTLLKRYRVALGTVPGERDQPAGSGIEEGVYLASRSTLKFFGDALELRRAEADGAVQPDTRRNAFWIHGPEFGQRFLARLHRLRDWADNGVGVTKREIEELQRVVPKGTPIEVRR